MRNNSERLEIKPFVARLSVEENTFFWDTYSEKDQVFPLLDHYNVALSDGQRFLNVSPDLKKDFSLLSYPLEMNVPEGKKGARMPLWHVFGELDPSEEKFLAFANKYGRLVSCINLTVGIGGRNRGNTHKSIYNVDTYDFWRQEVCRFNTMLRLERMIHDLDIIGLRKMICETDRISTLDVTMTSINCSGEEKKTEIKVGDRLNPCFVLESDHQGTCESNSISEAEKTLWEYSGGKEECIDLVRVAKGFIVDAINRGLSLFPVEIGFSVDPKDFLIKRWFRASSLLSALYLSYSLHWTKDTLDFICAECRAPGNRADMVHKRNGDYVHKEEDRALRKRKSREKRMNRE